MSIYSRRSDALIRIFFRLIVGILGVVALASCHRLRIAREVTLDSGAPTMPVSIVNAADAGYFVAIQAEVPGILKINNIGAIKWKFEEHPPGNTKGVVKMVGAVPGGGAIVCGSNNSGYPDRTTLPGFAILLDGNGREVNRLNTANGGSNGKPLYDFITCAPWGDGFVVSAIESKVDSESELKFDPIRDGRVVVVKLASDFSILWRKQVDVGGVGFPTAMPPREISSGDLIFPGAGKIFSLDMNGEVKASAPMPGTCRWLRAQPRDPSLRFVCSGDSSNSGVSIFEYDRGLSIIRTVHLANSQGLPIVVELPNGDYLSMIGGSNSQGPRTRHYDASGHALGSYNYSDGSLRDGASSSDEAAAVFLRAIEVNDHFVPNITWLEP